MEINKQIDAIITQLRTTLSESQLPIGVVFLILQNLYNDVEKQYYAFLNSEALRQSEEMQQTLQNLAATSSKEE